MKMDKPRYFVDLMEKMVRQNKLISLGESTQKRIRHALNVKTYVLSLAKNFPKKEKKLLSALSDGNSKDRIELRRLVGTSNLKSLVRDTRLNIKKFGYHHLLIIQCSKGSGTKPKYYYKLIASINPPTPDKGK
jgi:hypothetical protein